MQLGKHIIGLKINMDNFNLKKIVQESINDHEKTFAHVHSFQFQENLKRTINMIYESIKSNNSILTCGNGGSFADAQHFTAELVVKFKRERDPISSITLGSNLSNLSACANDFSYENVFKREYIAISKKNDTLIAISTSGNSRNIRVLLDYALDKEMKWIFLTSDLVKNEPKGGVVFKFPFTTTAAVQESHIFTLQLICRAIDDLLLGSE